MVERTAHDDELTREEVAAYLRELADELESGNSVSVPIGNKVVRLGPPKRVNFSTEVRERSRLIGKRKVALALELNWRTR